MWPFLDQLHMIYIFFKGFPKSWRATPSFHPSHWISRSQGLLSGTASWKYGSWTFNCLLYNMTDIWKGNMFSLKQIIHSQNTVPSFMLIPVFWIRCLYSVWNTNHSFQMVLRYLLIAVTNKPPPLKDWLGLAAFYHQEWVFLRSFPQTNFLASLFSEKLNTCPETVV